MGKVQALLFILRKLGKTVTIANTKKIISKFLYGSYYLLSKKFFLTILLCSGIGINITDFKYLLKQPNWDLTQYSIRLYNHIIFIYVLYENDMYKVIE